ncbi:hypothetical protein diail_8387 [Diaporthe ilicicola]|nr:hypothetical protein diail_8387 [Diaporthe ilicicola]
MASLPDLAKFTTPTRPLTWLITGCSSGFGLAIARHALANGHKVIATSRNPAKTPQLVQEIESSGGRWVQLDLDDPGNGKVIDDLEAEGTTIDVLVNNAGSALLQAAESVTEDEVRAQFETVFFGPYRLTRAALPHMRKRRFGIVVNIRLTKVLAKEVAPFNVRTLTVYLGGFKTSFLSAIRGGKERLSDGYQGTIVDQTLHIMHEGKYVPDGDTVKGARVVYEVVTGQGVGAGKEGELNLPLGRDMEARVKLVRDRMDHCWEVFGDVATNVYVNPDN